MNIDLVVGARPNFVKAAAILHAAEKFPQLNIKLIHTGQHKDVMSDPYFKELGLPKPILMDIVRGETPVSRFGNMVDALGHWWRNNAFDHDKPDIVMVVGDTDSTSAGAIAAVKSRIPVIHVEAGLRCGDMRMQEELNRLLVDSVSTKLYTTSAWAQNSLKREGKAGVLVGNVMVDTLKRFLPEAVEKFPYKDRYAVLTLHRAENVDDEKKFSGILEAVMQVGRDIPVIWPTHPRYGSIQSDSITVVEPMGYLRFISMLSSAEFVMTDSGGVQEETTALGVPCITLRDCTERPETIFNGTNMVVGTKWDAILRGVDIVTNTDVGFWKSKPKPDLWDGHASERILEDICATLL